MRILLIVFLFCLSSCGIFKKSTKHYKKEVEIEKVVENKEAKKESEEIISEKETKKTNENSNVREERNLDNETTITADKIKIGKDGSVFAEGNVKLKNRLKDTIKKDSLGAKNIEENLTKDSIVIKKEETKDFSNIEKESVSLDKGKVSEPSSKGIIIFAIVGCLIVLGVFFYLGIKPKK